MMHWRASRLLASLPDHTLPEEVEIELEVHVASCTNCRGRLREMELAEELLQLPPERFHLRFAQHTDACNVTVLVKERDLLVRKSVRRDRLARRVLLKQVLVKQALVKQVADGTVITRQVSCHGILRFVASYNLAQP